MPNISVFDSKSHHIRLVGFMRTSGAAGYEFRAILDTGASFTEFSDQFLQFVGLTTEVDKKISAKTGLQTQKYGKIIVPEVRICGHVIHDMTAYISHFEKHWGVDALIGLDFFRRFRVTIDYQKGHPITEPYK